MLRDSPGAFVVSPRDSARGLPCSSAIAIAISAARRSIASGAVPIVRTRVVVGMRQQFARALAAAGQARPIWSAPAVLQVSAISFGGAGLTVWRQDGRVGPSLACDQIAELICHRASIHGMEIVGTAWYVSAVITDGGMDDGRTYQAPFARIGNNTDRGRGEARGRLGHHRFARPQHT